ncbi:hypothetical protein M5K25_011845 [Dendrobium thyrsiflorum]|uniref:Uncharacterized protein n=1 Tax=Dendrobium thyrsiflorum TaxID=117978 RepID=A0ABD0V3D4_DENTH
MSNEAEARQLLATTINTYRDELDGLLDSQVIWEPYTPDVRAHLGDICLLREQIWMTLYILQLDPSFIHSDGRGKSDIDWMIYYHNFIIMWEDRRSCIVQGIVAGHDSERLIHRYLQWFRSWATLYILKPLVEPPTTYYHRAPLEPHLHSCRPIILRRAVPWPTDDYVPMTIPSTDKEAVAHHAELHKLRDRPLRAPQHYTPGTYVIPRRMKKKC